MVWAKPSTLTYFPYGYDIYVVFQYVNVNEIENPFN